ncbi:MAG: nucleotidyltransferase domain-containing protein [Verrucomicrobia bacterium]|nr:nucleotidyltransferase domain-containing protein [Verrucomicrobiota bacterium]MCF7707418.1 nucleotidyltransferase domain-containing protein [Verrucomicrobiota bacterium]
MIDLIRNQQRQIEDICRRLNIRRLEVFGSAAAGEFDVGRSDVDFIVEFEEPESSPGLLSRYLALADALEKLLGRKVEIVTPQSIRNPYFRQAVEATREPLYAA